MKFTKTACFIITDNVKRVKTFALQRLVTAVNAATVSTDLTITVTCSTTVLEDAL